MLSTVVSTITLKVQGDGTALERKDVSTFGLTKVHLLAIGSVSYVPDPDNADKTIFWVQGATPETTAHVELTYPAE